jgi:hypothetical protein
MDYSYTLTKEQYDYLLPVFGNSSQGTKRLLTRIDRKVDKYYFIGTNDDYLDALNRCKYL